MYKLIVFTLIFSIIPVNYLSSIIPHSESLRLAFFLIVFMLITLKYLENSTAVNIKVFSILLMITLFLIYILLSSRLHINIFFISDFLKILYDIFFSFVVLVVWKVNKCSYIKKLYKIILFLFLIYLIDISLTIIILKPISAESGELILSGITGRAFTAYNALFFLIFGLLFLKHYRFYPFFIIIISSIVVVFSSVRLAMGTEILITGMYFIHKKKIKYLLIIFGLMTSLIFLQSQSLWKEMFLSNNIDFSNINDILSNVRFTGRLAFWEDSIESWKNNFWIGNGWGFNNSMLFFKYGIQQTHNDYIRILSDLGVIGLLLYLSIYIVVLFNVRFSKNEYKIYIYFIILTILFIGLTDNFIAYSCYYFPYFILAYKLILLEDKKV